MLECSWIWQPLINVSLANHVGRSPVLYFFIHNKDQMYLPKQDEAFGSYYIFKIFPRGKNSRQSYSLHRDHWKALPTESHRCDVKASVNTTSCITKYMEHTIGCSMGMRGGNPDLKRYYFFPRLAHKLFTFLNILDAMKPDNSSNMQHWQRTLSSLLMILKLTDWLAACQAVKNTITLRTQCMNVNGITMEQIRTGLNSGSPTANMREKSR